VRAREASGGRLAVVADKKEQRPLPQTMAQSPNAARNTQRSIVPFRGRGSILKVAPTVWARYFIIWTPIPFGFLFFASPLPLSVTSRTIALFSREREITISLGLPCLR